MTAEQKDKVLSRSEDPLQCLHQSKPDPLIRSRPLSDTYPSQSLADRSSVPYLLSGCGAQIRPTGAAPLSDESRINGINSSAWSNPVIGPAERRPHNSRIMRLFSNSRKGVVPPSSPTADSPNNEDNSSTQPWTGFSGFGVVDSFKKLRSSVLQGIQSRGAASNSGQNVPLPIMEMPNGSAGNSSEADLADATNHLKIADGNHVSNGNLTDQISAEIKQYGSDIEDYDDEEADSGLARNSRFSRSIRRAYGAGRITLLDIENGRRVGSDKSVATCSTQKPNHRSKVDIQTETQKENSFVKPLSRLSKSAENLHIFKLPARRKSPCPEPPSPQEDPQRTTLSNGTPNIQRTSSTSSVDLRGRSSPMKNKGSMVKLIGSMTDLTARRKQGLPPSPTSPSLMSPLSRLHDDYSRRVPCLPTSERQRRPVAITAQVNSIKYTPLIHAAPENNAGLQSYQGVIDPLSSEPRNLPEQISADISTQHELLAAPAASNSEQMGFGLEDHRQASFTMVLVLCVPFQCIWRGPDPGREKQEVKSHLLEQGPLLQTEEVSTAASSPPPDPSTCLSNTPASPTSPTDGAAASTETTSVKPRRRSGRPRPRPISDYAQLVSRKHCIPEEVAEPNYEERTSDTRLHVKCSSDGNGSSPENCSSNGDVQRHRPVSVIGDVDLFPADTELKEDRLPSVSFYNLCPLQMVFLLHSWY
ncbi:hypothetical protein XENOCAPTIV_019137 [Xenoophorus captivus]|uniref:Uncharacterized protein n=1 Tax=Xenoophorus captivus TaxID=1517983 RepID=A0ABV0SDJ0_9TELE